MDVSPELLELLAEVNCLRTSIINSVGGDRHPEVEGKPREEPPKRPRGTPPQDSPPDAPSPKRMNDGVGVMDRDLGAEQPDPVTADQEVVEGIRSNSPPGRILGASATSGFMTSLMSSISPRSRPRPSFSPPWTRSTSRRQVGDSPSEGLPRGAASDPGEQLHHDQGTEQHQHEPDTGDQDLDGGLGSHGFPGFYPNNESYPIPPVIPYLVMDPRGGMTNLFSWAHQVADLTNEVNSRLANMESEVQQNADYWEQNSGSINSLARTITDALGNLTEMRQAVGNFQQNLGQLAQGFEPAARKSWLMHALQDESDVRTQIKLIVADELKA